MEAVVALIVRCFPKEIQQRAARWFPSLRYGHRAADRRFRGFRNFLSGNFAQLI